MPHVRSPWHACRAESRRLGEKLGQIILGENRPGGDTLLGTRYVTDAPADGHTILASANTISLLPQMRVAPGYDLARDFTGIGFMGRAPMILEVGADQPDRTLADFVARAKASPGLKLPRQ